LGNHHVATVRLQIHAAVWAFGLKPSGRWNGVADKALCPYFHGTLQSHVGMVLVRPTRGVDPNIGLELYVTTTIGTYSPQIKET